MADIDIGSPADNRPQYVSGGYTLIVVDNPANLSGIITEIKTFVETELNGCYFGIFENTGGLNFKCRSAVAIDIVAVGLVAHEVNLAVVAGDYIGMYFAGGNMDRNDAGGVGYWYEGSNNCVVDDETTYTFSGGRILSLEGSGAEVVAAAGRSFGFIMG